MPVVDITIGKRDFQLACGEGQESHLQKLASQVSERVETLSGSMDVSNDTLLLVMTSLMLQDEINDGGTPSNDNDESDEIIAEALNTISDYVETIATRIEKY